MLGLRTQRHKAIKTLHSVIPELDFLNEQSEFRKSSSGIFSVGNIKCWIHRSNTTKSARSSRGARSFLRCFLWCWVWCFLWCLVSFFLWCWVSEPNTIKLSKFFILSYPSWIFLMNKVNLESPHRVSKIRIWIPDELFLIS